MTRGSELFEPHSPILVRGLSRSGGTLLVSILDAHPDVAMQYELYPNLLDLSGEACSTAGDLAKILGSAKSTREAIRVSPNDRVRTFIRRLPRGGVSVSDLVQALTFAPESLLDEKTALAVIQRCAAVKALKKRSRRWGMKCLNGTVEYLEAFPDARFIDIVRDGRDVLASQQNTGAFNPDPRALGRSWAKTHRIFAGFADRSPNQCMLLRYEDLVSNPVGGIRALLDWLGLPDHPDCYRPHAVGLTIHGAQHLSGQRVASPIDTASIGRWRNEVSTADLTAFVEEAGTELVRFGYLTES